MTDAERKVQERRQERRRYLTFLDKRIPELLRGKEYPGRAAREQADKEWVGAA